MNYFGQKPSWLYHKLEAEAGSEEGFTDEELFKFKGALCDLSDRIRRVADSLQEREQLNKKAMKQRLEELKQQFVNAHTEQERQVVVSSIRQMIDHNAEEVAEWTLQQARNANQKADELLGKKQT